MTQTLKIGDMIQGVLPDGSIGIMIYKSDHQYLHELTHTKKGKPRKNLVGKRAKDAIQNYAEFKLEKRKALS